MYISQFLGPQLGIKPPHSPKFVCVHVSISWATGYISMSWATVYKTVNGYMFVSQFYVYICIYLNFLVHSSGSSSIPSCSALQCVAVYCSVLQLCCSVCCIVFLSLSLALSLSLSRSLSLFLSRSLALSLSHSLFLPPLNTEVHQLFKFVRVYSKGQICIHIRVICRIHMCGTTRLYV